MILKNKSLSFLYILLFGMVIPNFIVGQNTITVKKKSRIQGFYMSSKIGELFHFIYFDKNGNAIYFMECKRDKKYYYMLKECAKDTSRCSGMDYYKYNINEEFADKGISPFLHIEFYQISSDNELNYSSTMEGELKNEILYIKVIDRWTKFKFKKK